PPRSPLLPYTTLFRSELDVLRHALDNDATRVAQFWSEWSLSRAFWGARASGTHAPGLRELGDVGRVGFDWVVDYSSLPRHLAGPDRKSTRLNSSHVKI